MLIIAYLINYIAVIIVLIASIFVIINVYFKYFDIILNENKIIFNYKFIKEKKEFYLNEIKEFHYYQNFDNIYDSSARFKIILKDKKEPIYIKFFAFKDDDLKKLEACIKEKGIKTRFVYYTISRENEILPQDVGYDD